MLTARNGAVRTHTVPLGPLPTCTPFSVPVAMGLFSLPGWAVGAGRSQWDTCQSRREQPGASAPAGASPAAAPHGQAGVTLPAAHPRRHNRARERASGHQLLEHQEWR